jgi:hypothetical protein
MDIIQSQNLQLSLPNPKLENRRAARFTAPPGSFPLGQTVQIKGQDFVITMVGRGDKMDHVRAISTK